METLFFPWFQTHQGTKNYPAESRNRNFQMTIWPSEYSNVTQVSTIHVTRVSTTHVTRVSTVHVPRVSTAHVTRMSTTHGPNTPET